MKSLANRIALKFSLVIAALAVCLSVSVVALLRHSIRAREGRELTSAARQISRAVLGGADPASLSSSDLQGIPYYLTYTVYDAATARVVATNDPFVPVLPLTEGKTARWTQKEYYTDGDLNLLYCAEVFRPADPLAVQTALNMDQDTAEQLSGYLPRTLAFIFIPLLVLSYAAAFFIARQTLEPVSRMTKSAQKISSTNLDTALPVTKRGDELDTLALTFNNLFARLKIDFDRERAFTGNVSHELKTPIAVILGHANLIRRWGKDDPAQFAESTSELIAEAHSMESIVTNLLQLSRLESGAVKPKSERVELAPLFARLQKDTLGWADGTELVTAGTSRSIQDECRLPAVIADTELLYQVCTIIVSNSIKFAPVPAHIEITAGCCAENGCVAITFTDNGPGFAPDILPHVFERFYRGDSSHNRKAGGAGLGLSIAREIMNVMGGTIEAASLQNAGSAGGSSTDVHGAVVTLTLPQA